MHLTERNTTVVNPPPGRTRLARVGRDIVVALEKGLYQLVGRLAAADGPLGDVKDPLASPGDGLPWPSASFAPEVSAPS